MFFPTIPSPTQFAKQYKPSAVLRWGTASVMLKVLPIQSALATEVPYSGFQHATLAHHTFSLYDGIDTGGQVMAKKDKLTEVSKNRHHPRQSPQESPSTFPSRASRQGRIARNFQTGRRPQAPTGKNHQAPEESHLLAESHLRVPQPLAPTLGRVAFEGAGFSSS